MDSIGGTQGEILAQGVRMGNVTKFDSNPFVLVLPAKDRLPVPALGTKNCTHQALHMECVDYTG